MLLIFFLTLVHSGQYSPEESNPRVEETKSLAQDFFDTYAARSDWEGFPQTLIIEQLICQDSIAIGSGYFTPL